jgi:hypothetical protein
MNIPKDKKSRALIRAVLSSLGEDIKNQYTKKK